MLAMKKFGQFTYPTVQGLKKQRIKAQVYVSCDLLGFFNPFVSHGPPGHRVLSELTGSHECCHRHPYGLAF